MNYVSVIVQMDVVQLWSYREFEMGGALHISHFRHFNPFTTDVRRALPQMSRCNNTPLLFSMFKSQTCYTYERYCVLRFIEFIASFAVSAILEAGESERRRSIATREVPARSYRLVCHVCRERRARPCEDHRDHEMRPRVNFVA